jgi:hypothetical protein
MIMKIAAKALDPFCPLRFPLVPNDDHLPSLPLQCLNPRATPTTTTTSEATQTTRTTTTRATAIKTRPLEEDPARLDQERRRRQLEGTAVLGTVEGVGVGEATSSRSR